MESTVILAILAGLIGLVLFLLKGNTPNEPTTEKKRGKAVARDKSGPKGAIKKKSRIAAQIAQEAEEEEANKTEEDIDSEEEAERQAKLEKQRQTGMIGVDVKRKGKKYEQKMEEKEARRQQLEADKKEREEQKKKQQEEWDERDRLRKEEEEREKEEEAERQRILEEKRRQEEEAYNAMKVDFEIEEEGEINTEEQLSKEADLLSKFIEHIKTKKVVYLEELASGFSLKTQECIDRINQLLEDEVLTGVMDDRGKFIYVTNEELESVVKFVNTQGRVSKQELSRNSGRLINLNL